MTENQLDPLPWRAKQVLDPEVEQEGNDSIIQMVFDYELSCVAHILFSNYTWKNEDLQKLVEYYKSLPQSIHDDLLKMQKNCEPEQFAKIIEKHAKNTLPIYGKSIEMSSIDANCRSRIFHEARQFLGIGSANADELFNFVYAVMCEALDPIFKAVEIKTLLKKLNLLESLEQSGNRNDELGSDVNQSFSYECTKLFNEPKTDFPDFYEKLSPAITNFLAFFALHTIRTNCYAGFSVDGDLKIYQRDMYKKALEDKKSKPKSPASSSCDMEPTPKRIKIKQEKRESDEEEFCEIIEKNSAPKTTVQPSPPVVESKKEVKEDGEDYPEKHMLEQLDKQKHTLPVAFVAKFRVLVESNKHLRDEIQYYKLAIKQHFTDQAKGK